VVVVCESCSTRFRIDDARIPAKGRLVRCSQCKATFIAKPQDASFEETVQEVVAEVTGSGGSPVPEPAADLFDAAGEDLGETATRPGAPADDERWEFDEEPRKPAAEPEARAHFESPVETEPARSPLDDIGDPTEWDLLRGSVEPEASKAEFIERPEPPPPPPRVAAAPEPFLRPIVEETAAPPAPARTRRRAPVAASLGQLAGKTLRSAAWLALGLLTFVGAKPLLSIEASRDVARPPPRAIGLADGEARDVRGAFVENVFAPSLYVVQGELARPSADPRLGLRVQLQSATGAPVGEPVWAGAAHTPRDLRERTPDALQDEIAASAARVARGGRFVALFAEVPADAAGFGLSLEPLPEPPTAPEAVSQDAPQEAGAAAEATASSPPAPRPSSE
jgi:predicted Zn finger-like uncharacterized protein